MNTKTVFWNSTDPTPYAGGTVSASGYHYHSVFESKLQKPPIATGHAQRLEEQKRLIAHLHKVAQQRELTVQEKKALFASMIIDMGEVLPGYSDRREDWYGDDER